MRIEKINPAIWYLLALLWIALWAAIQTYIDRFYPFNNSIFVSQLLSGIAVFFCFNFSAQKLGWISANNDAQAVKTYHLKPEFQLQYWFFSGFVIVISMIFFARLTSHISVIEMHLKTGTAVFGLLAGVPFCRYFGIKRGWLVEKSAKINSETNSQEAL